MKIYLDNDFKCYVNKNENTTQEIETNFFNGKCKSFIEGYRFVPQGQSWTRDDGAVFTGEMVSPFKDFTLLNEVQKLYDEINLSQQKQDAQATYTAMMTDTLMIGE